MTLLGRPPSTTPLGLALLLTVALMGAPAPPADAAVPLIPATSRAPVAEAGLPPTHPRIARGTTPHVDRPATASFAAEWSWPLQPVPAVARPFEKPPEPWQRGHRGVDLRVTPSGAGAVGAPILSPADGVVSFAGTVVDRGVLSIDHGGGRVSSFEPVSTDLVKGQRVSEGDVVATLAPTGAASGPWHCASPCLHWGVRVEGDYVDPLGFVMDRRPSVLLPISGSNR